MATSAKEDIKAALSKLFTFINPFLLISCEYMYVYVNVYDWKLFCFWWLWSENHICKFLCLLLRNNFMTVFLLRWDNFLYGTQITLMSDRCQDATHTHFSEHFRGLCNGATSK